MSADGINWLRGDGLVEGHRSAEEQLKDVGVVLGPNGENWWTLDTAHLSVSDVQVRDDMLSGQGLGFMAYETSCNEYEHTTSSCGEQTPPNACSTEQGIVNYQWRKAAQVPPDFGARV